jgi:hypothetical protein
MRYNYNRMETLRDIAIVVGLAGTALLWVICTAAVLHAFWDTIGEHMHAGIERTKRLIKKR